MPRDSLQSRGIIYLKPMIAPILRLARSQILDIFPAIIRLDPILMLRIPLRPMPCHEKMSDLMRIIGFPIYLDFNIPLTPIQVSRLRTSLDFITRDPPKEFSRLRIIRQEEINSF
jgi:hypothetical protein